MKKNNEIFIMFIRSGYYLKTNVWIHFFHANILILNNNWRLNVCNTCKIPKNYHIE